MNREGHESAIFFVAGEVEKTPAFAKRTLFVVGFQDTQEIEKLARENKTPHIFLGANHSFDASHNTEHFAQTWDDQITYLLDKGFWVTLDYQAHQHETVLKILNPGIWQCRTFVPLLSVRIPKIETSSPNLTVKIDDVDFKATNAGVWCMHFREVTDSNRFTDWQDYESDNIINPVERKVAIIDVSELTEKDVDSIVEGFKTAKASEVINQTELGLDIEPTTALKPELPENVKKVVNTVDAASAYADGATADPVADEAKKAKTKK